MTALQDASDATGASDASSTRLSRRRLLAAGVGAAFAPLAACASLPGGQTTVVVEPAGVSFDADALSSAFLRRDQTAFARCFTGGELAARTWDSWVALGVRDVRRVDDRLRVIWPETQAPEPESQSKGTRGPARVPGCVEFALATSAQGRIASLRAASGIGVSQPVWLLEPVRRARAEDRMLLVAAEGVDAAATARWAEAARAATITLASVDLGPAAAGWDGRLVVALPSGLLTFAGASGLPSELAATTAAATVVPSDSSGALVLGNLSASASLDQAGLTALLVHEGVHAAMRSPLLQAPGWAVEGIAESAAQAADAATRASNTALLHGAPRPTALPSAAELIGSEAPLAYARAALAVDAAIGRWRRPAVMGWIADWSQPGRPSDAEFTSAYLAALPG